LSKDTRTRTPVTARNAKTSRKRTPGAETDEKARQVGTRAFVRRARATQGRRSPVRTSTSGRRLPRYAARLPTFPHGEAFRRIPRPALICALVACLNAICWSIVTAPFQVPDEPDHFAYVKQLAETASLPSSSSEQTSDEEIAGLIGLRYFQVRQQPQNHTITSQSEENSFNSLLTSTRRGGGSPAAGAATQQPPLYYALETIPYSVGGTLLDRLALMRLMSALMAGLTAIFVFLFVRETLPREPWAWTVGALAVALAPLLGFISGAVTPDSLLLAVSAAIFYGLARAFRRGLSTRGAATIGALTAVGFLTKLNFIGLAPGVLLGLTVLTVRAARVSGRSVYRGLAIAVGIAMSPVVLYVAINVLSNHEPLGVVSAAIRTTHGSLLGEINYIWQLYLPRLPGTVNDFPGLFTTRQLWFNGYVGLYGWLDTTFPGWVYSFALIPAGAIAFLCARALFDARVALRSRAAELVVYATMGIGVMALVGADSYRGFPEINAEYAEARYLLPMLALLGAVLALAARGAGRRWGPIAGALIVVLFLAHDVFSQMLVAARYYG
jgi:hypothetical protein